MWCKGCRQDVPALPSGDKQMLCCPRCGEAICAERFAAADKIATSIQPPIYDGWALDEQLQDFLRVLQSTKKADREPRAIGRRDVARFDPPQAGPPIRHVAAPERSSKEPESAGNRGSGSGVPAWFALTLGTTCFACGSILLGWSLATGRQELWSIGLPVALVGQIALLVGLVLQIDRLWNDNRKAAAKLDDVDEQIHELKESTLLLGATQNPTSATFYSHLAGGAGPHLLLTDLKSQLDLLAMKIARDE